MAIADVRVGVRVRRHHRIHSKNARMCTVVREKAHTKTGGAPPAKTRIIVKFVWAARFGLMLRDGDVRSILVGRSEIF